jgi:hypothetical protein
MDGTTLPNLVCLQSVTNTVQKIKRFLLLGYVDMWICLSYVEAWMIAFQLRFRTFPPVIHFFNRVIRTYPRSYPRTYPRKLVTMWEENGGWERAKQVERKQVNVLHSLACALFVSH